MNDHLPRPAPSWLSDLPNFVAALPQAATSPDDPSSYDHWAADRAGDPKADFKLGQQYFKEAILFSLGGHSLFLFFVLQAMGHKPYGDVEAGFIVELLTKVVAGNLAEPFCSEVERIIAADGGDVMTLRAQEEIMRIAILNAKAGETYAALEAITNAIGTSQRAGLSLLARTAQSGALN